MKKLPYFVSFAAAWLFIAVASAQENPVDYVNPFVGTTNYGTTNPGAICPQGMMSVVPFNVMGDKSVGNKIDKEQPWMSTPYDIPIPISPDSHMLI